MPRKERLSTNDLGMQQRNKNNASMDPEVDVALILESDSPVKRVVRSPDGY
jgi:hypothetical protein